MLRLFSESGAPVIKHEQGMLPREILSYYKRSDYGLQITRIFIVEEPAELLEVGKLEPEVGRETIELLATAEVVTTWPEKLFVAVTVTAESAGELEGELLEAELLEDETFEEVIFKEELLKPTLPDEELLVEEVLLEPALLP